MGGGPESDKKLVGVELSAGGKSFKLAVEPEQVLSSEYC